jgi:hypothetical protein
MLFDSAELLFAAVTLLCSLLYLFPYARLIHEQLAAQERSAQSRYQQGGERGNTVRDGGPYSSTPS